MAELVRILRNKIVGVYDTRTCGRIPLHIGQLPTGHAQSYVDKVSASFRRLNFTVEFYQTTNDIYWHGLLGFYPFIVCVDIGSRPSSGTATLSEYYAELKVWYDWCVANCQSEFIINEYGFVFENTDDYLLFKVAFGDPTMSN